MKKSLFSILVLMLSVMIMAGERNAEEAAQIAARFTNSQPQLRKALKSPRKPAELLLVQTRKKLNSESTAYYVFNQSENSGFVIVSGDDRTDEVLAYSDEGAFNADNINPNFRFWLNHITEVMSAIGDDEVVDKTPLKATTVIAPLLGNTTWEQGEPYNNLCPIDKWDNTRSYTGCVATAAAQIMRKWRWPVVGTGSKTYTWENYTYDNDGNPRTVLQRVKLSANFGETAYDWDNMLDRYYGVKYTDAQAEAVATLMYHCGVACEMMYGGDKAGGSGSFTELMGEGLEKYFNYRYERFLTTYSKSDYTDNGKYPMPDGMLVEWKATTDRFIECFNQDLEAGRPILMGGASDEAGGHEFVCDGRDANGKFHINWGWEGDGNCYCTLTLLKPQGEKYSFSSTIDALIGLEPIDMDIDTVYVTGVSMSPMFLTLKINEKSTLVATVEPENATFKSVTWASSNPEVAEVDAAGRVMGVSAGQTEITATTVDGGFQTRCKVTVTNEILVNTEFTLVSKDSELQDGHQIIIVGIHDSQAQAATLNITSSQTVSYMGTEDVVLNGNAISLSESSNVAVFTLKGNYTSTSYTWTLVNQEGDTLGANSTKKLMWDGTHNEWTISINGGNATISPGTNKGRILYNYNNGNPRFTTYLSNTTTSMLLPQIFSRKTPVIPSAVTEINAEQTATKLIRDGRVLIIRDGVTYDIFGRRVQ